MTVTDSHAGRCEAVARLVINVLHCVCAFMARIVISPSACILRVSGATQFPRLRLSEEAIHPDSQRVHPMAISGSGTYGERVTD